MTRSRIWLSLTFAFSALGLGAASASAGSTTTSICEISRHPGRYDGKVVTVEARLIGEFHHGFLLTSADCKGVLNFAIPKSEPTEARMIAFREILEPWRYRGPDRKAGIGADRDIDVVLTARVETYAPQEGLMCASMAAGSGCFSASKPTGRARQAHLDIESVLDLRVYELVRTRREIVGHY